MLLGPGIVPGFLFWACPGGVSDVGMQGFDVEKGEKRVGKDDFDASVRSLGEVNKGNMSGTRVDVRKGSLADMRAPIWDVRFTPQSRHCSAWASMSAKCQKQTS